MNRNRSGPYPTNGRSQRRLRSSKANQGWSTISSHDTFQWVNRPPEKPPSTSPLIELNRTATSAAVGSMATGMDLVPSPESGLPALG